MSGDSGTGRAGPGRAGAAPAPELDGLEASLEHCLLCDRKGLRKRLEALRRRAAGRGALARLQRDVARSREVCERRAALRPGLEYPPDLPFSAHVAELAALIEAHQVVLVRGETGSGKSTQLPKLCLELGRGIHGRIGHTQPRRIAARSIAARIAEETRTRPGRLAGHCVRFDDNLAPEARVKVMTDGILLNEIHADPFFEQYDTLIIDEIHERTLNVDFLIGYLERIRARRPELKIVLTSATVNSRPFERLFGDLEVFEIAGRHFPIDLRYRAPESDDASGESDDVYAAIVEAVRELDAEARGDILVFLPGEREIREAARCIAGARFDATDVLPLYGRLSAGRQSRIFRPGARRRIVLATNVAETSLTVPRVRHVIDTGIARVSRYDPRRKLQQLPIEKIAKANADQRMGRCGREAPGVCIRLYDEADYHARRDAIEPEIQRTNLGGVILRLKAMGVHDVERFAFASPPDTRLIRDGYTLLQEIGALDAARALTPTGTRLARLPLDPRLARVLVSAEGYGCLSECLIIAAGLSIADPRERPHERREAADRAHAAFADKRSDFLWFVNAWQFARDLHKLPVRKRSRRCRRRFLSASRMQEWVEVYDQLRQFVRGFGLSLNAEPATYKDIHTALASGFLSHVGEWQGDHYAGCRNASFRLHPSSGLAKRPPRWIVAAEIVETAERFARTAGRIDPQWLEPVAGSLVRRTHEAPRWDRRRGSVRATEIQRLYGLVINRSKAIDFVNVDASAARAIFIDAGILDGDLGEEPECLRRNRALIARVQELEARARRRDLLQPRSALRAFYDERLPPEIVTRRALMRWLRASPANGVQLTMTERDVTNEHLNSVATWLYPDRLDVAGTPCPLAYRFEPGGVRDGITVSVPAVLLARLRPEHIDRLVPGALSEKVEALLRGMPKAQRRLVSPIREYAMACLEAIESSPGPLADALRAAIEKMTGIGPAPQALDERGLAPHLRMNVVVLDEDGRELASSRDLEALQAGHGVQAREALESVDWGIGGSSAGPWTFGDIPVRVEVATAATALVGFPALVDTGDTVSLEVLDGRETAQHAHQLGLARLLFLGASRERRDLARAVAGAGELALQAALYGYAAEPLDMLVLALAQRAAQASNAVPRRAAEYAGLEREFRQSLAARAGRATGELLELFARGRRVRERLEELSFAPAAAKADIRSQVDWLLGPSLVTRIADREITRYGCYFDAIERRMERLESNPGKDLGKLDRVTPLWDTFLRLAADDRAVVRATRAVHTALEEYRVATFAPELGVASKVTPEQLQAALQTLADEV